MSAERPVVIAVDGPAAAGKGTLARRLAADLQLGYLDTGLLYRAVARRVLDAGEDPADATAAAAAARAINADDLAGPRLRDESVGEAASKVAAVPAVRAALLMPSSVSRADGRCPRLLAVMDGRDIGTVVCPAADVKLYVTASPEERARRRHKELLDRGVTSIYSRVLADVIARDSRDSERDVAPLRQATSAFVLDTTDLDAEAAYRAARRHIETVIFAKRCGP